MDSAVNLLEDTNELLIFIGLGVAFLAVVAYVGWRWFSGMLGDVKEYAALAEEHSSHKPTRPLRPENYDPDATHLPGFLGRIPKPVVAAIAIVLCIVTFILFLMLEGEI